MSTEIKETTNEVATGTNTTNTTNTKKQTWLNRIWSAIVGAILAVGAMFGITTEQVAEEKAKVETVQTKAKEALDAIKAGNIEAATEKLTEATTVVKEVVKDVTEKANEVKNADMKEVGKTALKGAVDTLTKDNLKKIESNTAQYKENASSK